MSLVLVEIMTKRKVEEGGGGGRRIRKFRRYVEDNIHIWIGKLEEKLKSMGKKDEKVRAKCYQKEENAGIFCDKGSKVDEGNKRNLLKSIERKIKRLTVEEKEGKGLEEGLWNQLVRNG